MQKVSRRPLTENEKADAERLRAIWLQKKDKLHLTQERVAEEMGWSSQSSMSQYINAKIALNLKTVLHLARLLEVEPEEISPRLVRSIGGVNQPNARYSIMIVRGYDEEKEVRLETHAPLRVISAELSAGAGADNGLEFEEKPLYFARHTLRRCDVQEENAVVVRVIGNSMSPVFVDGDTVAVDIADREQIKDGMPYAIRDVDMDRVKVLYQRPGGGLRLRSFNSEEYPDEDLTAEQVRERVRVIGRVFWSSRLWK